MCKETKTSLEIVSEAFNEETYYLIPDNVKLVSLLTHDILFILDDYEDRMQPIVHKLISERVDGLLTIVNALNDLKQMSAFTDILNLCCELKEKKTA